MNKVQKWNVYTHEYDPYVYPKEWKLSWHEYDLDAVVNCAECGLETRYGDCYTSRFIHGCFLSLGYVVCPLCHEMEMEKNAGLRF